MVQKSFVNTVSLEQGLGGMRDVVNSIIIHEQAQSNRICSFQTLDIQ